MTVRPPRTLGTVTGAGGLPGPYEPALDPADAVQERFDAGVLDVLSLGGLADERQHDFVVDGLLHELRKRGIVKDVYRGDTLRENLGLELPDGEGGDRP